MNGGQQCVYLRRENKKLRADKAELIEALQEVLKTYEDGVIHRTETGKPKWSAFSHMKTIASAVITKLSR
jgi:hypothetical protein